MKTYCPNCGQVNEWSGIKPNKCEFCSEPFIRKITVTKKTVASKKEDQNIVEIEEKEDFDIPTFEIKAHSNPRVTIGSINQNGKVELVNGGEQTTERDSEERGITPFKQEVLKHMLNPTPQR
jgi:hypothetical protein